MLEFELWWCEDCKKWGVEKSVRDFKAASREAHKRSSPDCHPVDHGFWSKDIRFEVTGNLSNCIQSYQEAMKRIADNYERVVSQPAST